MTKKHETIKDIRNEKWTIKELNSIGIFKRYHILTETPTDKNKLQNDYCYLQTKKPIKTNSEHYIPIKCLMLLNNEIVYFQDIKINLTPYKNIIKN